MVAPFPLVSREAGFMHVPGSGLCVAKARAAGVEFIAKWGGLGGLDEFGCWSVESPLGCSPVRFAGGVFSGSGLLPVVPMFEVDGVLLFWPEAPVVEVVLLC
jgi:hypothetical protein